MVRSLLSLSPAAQSWFKLRHHFLSHVFATSCFCATCQMKRAGWRRVRAPSLRSHLFFVFGSDWSCSLRSSGSVLVRGDRNMLLGQNDHDDAKIVSSLFYILTCFVRLFISVLFEPAARPWHSLVLTFGPTSKPERPTFIGLAVNDPRCSLEQSSFWSLSLQLTAFTVLFLFKLWGAAAVGPKGHMWHESHRLQTRARLVLVGCLQLRTDQ